MPVALLTEFLFRAITFTIATTIYIAIAIGIAIAGAMHDPIDNDISIVIANVILIANDIGITKNVMERIWLLQ